MPRARPGGAAKAANDVPVPESLDNQPIAKTGRKRIPDPKEDENLPQKKVRLLLTLHSLYMSTHK